MNKPAEGLLTVFQLRVLLIHTTILYFFNHHLCEQLLKTGTRLIMELPLVDPELVLQCQEEVGLEEGIKLWKPVYSYIRTYIRTCTFNEIEAQ